MNEKIDFFIPQCQTENITTSEFGICDNPDESKKTPAYVSFDRQDKWTAVVKNDTDVPLNFTAVDNCVEMHRENGEMDNRCDAMLTNSQNIIFVELKTQQTDWIRHAVEDQLQTTIDRFKENHDISLYRHKRAFVCNSRHPRFNVSYKQRMNDFYQRNHVRLCIEQNIIIK